MLAGPPSAFSLEIASLNNSLPLSTTPLSSSANLPVPSLLKAPSDEIIYEHFRLEVQRRSPKRANRIRYLVEAAQGFWDACLRSTPEDVSTIPSEIDTNLLDNIHIAHYVGLRVKKLKISGRGVGSLTAAIDETAHDLSLKRPEVQKQYMASKGYMNLILHSNGGPGSLLLLGPHRHLKMVWQRYLRDTDIQILLHYRKRHMPDHYAKSVKLDAIASKIIINYMVAKGWGYKELASIDSDLMRCLGTHIDLEQLVREEGSEFAFTHTPTHFPDHCLSEGASEDLAFRELVKPAQETVITKFVKPFQEDGQLNMSIGKFPIMMPPIEEPEVGRYIENFHQVNHWILDLFPAIPVPVKQDHLRNPQPHRFVARADDQIDDTFGNCLAQMSTASQSNAFNLQHSDYYEQQLAQNRLTLGLASDCETCTNSVLHDWPDNGSQGVAGLPGTGIIKVPDALYLWPV